MTTKDEIARLRAEARHFREHAKAARAKAKRCKDERDWVGALKARDRANEYVRAAQERDALAKELRARI